MSQVAVNKVRANQVFGVSSSKKASPGKEESKDVEEFDMGNICQMEQDAIKTEINKKL